MAFQEGICILCLDKCENFKIIDENTKNVLDIFLLKIDFTVIQEPAMCKNCEEMLMKCFDFKETCLRTHNYIIPFVNKKDDVKLDLKDVYLNKDVTGTGVPEDQNICGFCMGLVKKYSTLSLDVEDIMLKKMIKLCLPEIDLNFFKKPVICMPCHGALENCFRFVVNCLVVEEKIKKYCETLDVKSKGQIELSNLLQFTMRDLTSEVGGNSVNIIKVEEQFREDRINPDEKEIGNGGDIIKLEQMSFDDSEDANEDVENKNESFTEMGDQKVNNEHQVIPKNILAWKKESDNLDSIKKEEIFCEDNKTKHKEENVVEMDDQKFLLDEEIEIKTDEHDFNRFENGIILPHPEGHKDPSDVTMFKCGSCLFQTKYKQSLERHLLMHKDPSEVAMYKCDHCSRQTKHKGGIKMHLRTHEDPSEVTVYKCDSCSFQTKYKGSFKAHLLKHKDPSEVTMHKCNYCSYQTKRKSYLKLHLLKHKDPSEVTMYKCDYCSYQAYRKYKLTRHLLIHMDPSKVVMYKCGSCSFETKYKNVLEMHLRNHKDPSEITMYKCDYCYFETKRKGYLKLHLLKHKDPSDVTMYKCYHCSHQTKRKCDLKTHLLKHKDPSEVTMHKCNYCSYQTKRKSYLKTHWLKHKDPSEVTIYKCDYCSYQVYREDKLAKHLLKHKDPSKPASYWKEK